ncbi:MAG: transglutaminase domain-containing protein [Eubacteriales bacterium]|nr:transglutaminase domain-containing protein [Eubacteriales bacterium]
MMKYVRNIFILIVCVGLVCRQSGSVVNAKSTSNCLPDSVCVVKNEKQLMSKMIGGMKKHKTYFAFYYPGIEKDFKCYQKGNNNYRDFWVKVANKNGYYAGITSGSCIMLTGESPQYIVIQMGYLTTKKQERYIDQQIKKIVKQIGAGKPESRVRKAHDYIRKHMVYSNQYYSPYDALKRGKGMCMSYALLFQRMMQEMKIPCRYIRGTNHAWNRVKVNGIWYNIDVTWDDNASNPYRYFLKRDWEFHGHDR